MRTDDDECHLKLHCIRGDAAELLCSGPTHMISHQRSPVVWSNLTKEEHRAEPALQSRFTEVGEPIASGGLDPGRRRFRSLPLCRTITRTAHARWQ